MSRPGERLIEARDIGLRGRGRDILNGIDLDVDSGRIVTLIGPNGAGKTSLVRVVLGLLQPHRGKVWRRPGLRIGYMPQRLELSANLPLTVHRFLTLAEGGILDALPALSERLGIAALLASPMQALSGGERQRVLLARALLHEPDLLVLDEPVQGVDVTGQAELYGLIATIRRERGCGVLMISHDLHLVMAATDQVVCLNTHVCCSGHPESVSRHPAYLELFGNPASANLAIYTHHHDHTHDIHGGVRHECKDCPHG